MRIVLGVVAGFFSWTFLWFGCETILSATWPEFGAHQTAFQAAIENGGTFTSNTTILLVHCVLAALVSLLAGLISATVAGENRRASLILGLLLLALGVLKAVMSWPLVPIWYHFIFTCLLLSMTITGGRLKATI